jgi:hypothetical protein
MIFASMILLFGGGSKTRLRSQPYPPPVCTKNGFIV